MNPQPIPFTYEERYVAFVDILGFKEKVRRLTENTQVFEILIALPTTLSATVAESNKIYQDVDIQGTAFSDCLVISTSASRGSFPGIHSVLKVVQKITEKLLVARAMVRGGLAKGPMYHRDGVAFGSGMIAAIKLESDVAKEPRIVVAPEVEAEWTASFDNGRWIVADRPMIVKDKDGLAIVDPFFFPEGDSTTHAFFTRAGDALSTMLNEADANLAGWAKAAWLAGQYNDSSFVRRLAKSTHKLKPIAIPSPPRTLE